MKSIKYLLIMFSLVTIVSCSIEESITEPEDQFILVLDSEIELSFAEPSGLTYDPDTQTLWTVNDPPNNKIYNINLDGELLETLTFIGNDLEGIAFDINTNTLWIAEEGTFEIINVSLLGEELQREHLSLSQYNSDSGLEGLCLGNSGKFYLLKEKEPGLFIEVSQDFSTLTETELSFADDYSGICYDSTKDGFWIVSDESEKLYLWDLTNGVREEYPLNFPKAEGIVFIAETNSFYIVSDSEEKLYKFHIEER
ncbi:MAG: SdiA-regulated domain-containing protein [Candidatus Tenebribacter mawsonii]|nr:SdiA-regulated domain-containing protein [Candidatus Tenebribacter mawsonii]